MQHLRDQILATTDAATIFALLRLDSKMVHIDPQIPMSIVQKAKEHDLRQVLLMFYDEDREANLVTPKPFNRT